jgi:hypothetical protein
MTIPLRRISESDQVITLGWDPVPGQVGYVPMIDGSDRLTDGKCHVGYPSAATQVRIGKPQDGQTHTYSVRILGVEEEGVYVPGGASSIEPLPPQGTMRFRDGNRQVSSYADAFVRTTGPFTVANQQIQEVTGVGVGAMQFWPPSDTTPERGAIRDCIVTDVSTVPPGKSGGTAEANAWIGAPTDVDRLVLERSGWTLMNILAYSQGSRIRDVLMRDAPVGGYFEHLAHDILVERCRTENISTRPVAGGAEPLGLLAGRSWTLEWWYYDPVYGGQLVGPYAIEFRDVPIYCPPPDPRFTAAGFIDPCSGVFIGPGCHTIKFTGRTTFFGPGLAIYAPTIRYQNGPDVLIEPTVRFDNLGGRLKYHSLPMGSPQTLMAMQRDQQPFRHDIAMREAA